MNVYFLSTTQTGIDLIELVRHHIPIRGIIGLSQREKTDTISGYSFLEQYCINNAYEFHQVSTYDLSGVEDRKTIMALSIDVLIVSGWQRLIPSWLIEHCRVGAFGNHGSHSGITSGRGRSPENWALILGKEDFSISLFKINQKIDEGNVIQTRNYKLSEWDDVFSARYKGIWLVGQMLISAYKDGSLFSSGISQMGTPSYLPKRIPQDGEIDWRRSAIEIYNFVRALSHPYPGAFSILPDGLIKIWRSIPLENLDGFENYRPGEIIRVFSEENKILIKTGLGALLVTEYETVSNGESSFIASGVILPSTSFREQLADVIQRHLQKYPNNSVHEDILTQS